ncbi:MAG: tryptophan 2,3-dioxygenase family protein [Bacteroidota bacterium]
MDSFTLAKDKGLLQQLEQLRQRYSAEGQSLNCHLERLRMEVNLDYDNYLCLDTLLTLQKPKTLYADEFIFIVYHQIVELYFQLMLWELKQLTQLHPRPEPAVFVEKIERISRYFEIINASFVVMGEGMDKEEFLQFRYALFPASGFQSAQFRLIEAHATDAYNLLGYKWRQQLSRDLPLETLYEKSYWKRGAIDVATNSKSVTLTDFEKKHDGTLLATLRTMRYTNLNQIYLNHYLPLDSDQQIARALRRFDQLANIHWPDAHLKVAMKYLGHNGPKAAKSTGGTNWRKYLNPRFQRISYFPRLWSPEELENWGHHHKK